jgi:predicted glycosyltransferase
VAEAVDLVRQRIDLVLVHGDPRLVTFDRTFAGAPAIAERLRYTGYVVEHAVAAAAADRRQGEILVSAGGGAVGAPLLTAALAARPLSRFADRPWRLITGRNLPAGDAGILRHAAAPQVTIETFRPDFTRLLQSCLLSVSQGGYNTVMELIAARCPAVIVPFAEGAESEQSLRAALLAERGVLSVLAPAALTAQNLAAAIDRHHDPAAGFALDLDGARRSADILLRQGRGLS